MLHGNAVLPLEIAVAKIKLTLGRNYPNTFHCSLWLTKWHRQHWEWSCASEEGPKCPRPRRESLSGIAFETELPSSHPFPETQKSLLKFKVQISSLPSVFVFSSEKGGGAQWLGKEKESYILSSARVGFFPLLSHHPQDQGKLLRQQSLIGRSTFKAIGRHPSSPKTHVNASVLAVLRSNLKHMPASSGTAQEPNATKGLNKFLGTRGGKTPGAVQVQNYSLPLLIMPDSWVFALGLRYSNVWVFLFYHFKK